MKSTYLQPEHQATAGQVSEGPSNKVSLHPLVSEDRLLCASKRSSWIVLAFTSSHFPAATAKLRTL